MSLEQTDLVSLNRLGERIQTALSVAMSHLPMQAKSIAGLSAFLTYNRSNSQRILNAFRSKDGLQVLTQLPGIAGQQEFADKVSEHIPKPALVELKQVFSLFCQALNQYARSHAELKRLLNEPLQKEITDPSEQDKREALFSASKSLLGSHINTLFCCYVLTPNKHKPQFLHEFAMISKLGMIRSPASPPFVQFYTHEHPDNFDKPELIDETSRLNATQFHIGIAKEYSTPQLENYYSSYSHSNSGLVFEDITNQSFDATFLFSNPDELANPLVDATHCSSTSISIKTPTKKMLMMVLLDKQIDRRSTVNVGCYMGNQKVKEGKLRASDLWTERLPEFPELSIIDLAAPNRHSVAGINAKQMCDYLLNYARLDGNQFRCYLIEIDYPVWSSTYRIYFEHDIV